MPTNPEEPSISSFPLGKALCGPVTASRIKRLILAYVTVALCGCALALNAHSIAWQIFGLGLVLPGGGFLAHADLHSFSGIIHIGLAMGGLAAFICALMVWFATGNVLLPPAAWLMIAGLATTMRHGHVHASSLGLVITATTTILIAATAYAYYAMLKGNHERRIANDWLKQNGPATVAGFSKASDAQHELSHDDLRRMRFLLDRALQPVNEFNGFEWLDQFQTAAIRYQLNLIGYALSMAQATHLPAFQGYLTEAQRRLLLKQTNYRVWRYWTAENLWGNLRYDPDPVKRENIMYTGFCATQMAMFHNASGCGDFLQSGSFALKHPSGQIYSYDLHALITSMMRETEGSSFHLIACEPNWIYPLCNTIGAAAIKSHSPAEWAAQQHRFSKMLDQEFLGYGTSIIPCRSNYSGLALPTIGGAMPQAMPCFFMNATMPDIAIRQWLQLRRNILKNGTLDRKKFWRIDTGNYRFSRAAAYTATALAAAELGDDHVKDFCLTALEDECPSITDGENTHRPKASIWAHAVEFMARVTTPNAFRELITAPKIHARPYLHSVSYPDVMVAAAHGTKDSLRIVLYPSRTPSRQAIHISGLTPGLSYSCAGTEEQSLVAKADATAILYVHLHGRTDISIKPAT